MRKWIGMLLIIALFSAPAAGLAASPWTEASNYSDKATGKFKFGFKNMVLGWTELFTEPQEAISADKNVLTGFGKGLINAPIYTVGGALHFFSFPLTDIDVPLPENGLSFK